MKIDHSLAYSRKWGAIDCKIRASLDRTSYNIAWYKLCILTSRRLEELYIGPVLLDLHDKNL